MESDELGLPRAGIGARGVLALLGTPELAFVVNGAAFLVSAATLLFVHIPPQKSLLLRK